MPASFVKCVDDLIKQGKDKGSAYAICTVSYKKTHKGHTPQQDEKKSKASDMVTLEEIKAMGQFYEEVVAARKKKKLTKKDMQDMMDEQMKMNNHLKMKGMEKQ